MACNGDYKRDTYELSELILYFYILREMQQI